MSYDSWKEEGCDAGLDDAAMKTRCNICDVKGEDHDSADHEFEWPEDDDYYDPN